MGDVTITAETQEWIDSLSSDDYDAVIAALRELEEHGENLGSRFVKQIKASRHAEMRELRAVPTHLRLLFALTPAGGVLVFVGGDKTGEWNAWYDRNVPLADDLYDDHLTT